MADASGFQSADDVVREQLKVSVARSWTGSVKKDETMEGGDMGEQLSGRTSAGSIGASGGVTHPPTNTSTAQPSSSGEEPKDWRAYVQHKSECECNPNWRTNRGKTVGLETTREKQWNGDIHEWQPHSCGLSGYDPMQGDTCIGCSTPRIVRPAKCTCGLDALLAASQGVSEKASPCANGHTWSMEFDADPERGTICDCGKKKWGERIAEIRVKTPEFDNHHNALACPYCNPNKLKFVEPAVGGSPEQKELRAASQAPSAPAIRHDQGLAIAKALRGELSHGKLAEILNIKDVHAFKIAAGSFDEHLSPSAPAVIREIVQEMRDSASRRGMSAWGEYALATEAQIVTQWADRLAPLCLHGDR